MGVRPQVTDYAGFPGNAGSSAPDGLLVSFRFQQGGSPAGGVFDLHQPDFAQLPTANHLAGLAYYRIAAIAVGHAENQAGLAYQAHQRKSLLYIDGQGLVADDINTLFQKGFGNRVMAIVGGHNADHLQAIFPPSLLLCHLLPGAVAAVPDNSPPGGKTPAPPRRPGRNAPGQRATGGKPGRLAGGRTAIDTRAPPTPAET